MLVLSRAVEKMMPRPSCGLLQSGLQSLDVYVGKVKLCRGVLLCLGVSIGVCLLKSLIVKIIDSLSVMDVERRPVGAPYSFGFFVE